MFDEGLPIESSAKLFEEMAVRVFKRRKTLRIPLQLPFLGRVALTVPIPSRLFELAVTYITDGLYPAENIESILKEVFGTEKSILDCSYAASIGTKLGMLVATVSKHPICRIFANYTNTREMSDQQGEYGISLSLKHIAN